MERIYLDHASLTPIDKRVIKEMRRYSSASFANPSSIYKEGVAAKKALEEGRKRVAVFLGAHADEVVFTSGGTEANGLALEGAVRAANREGIAKPHLIISTIEHSSIMERALMMEERGVCVTRLSVDATGLISLDELKKAMTPQTLMVSIMAVNNEIGSIQPIREIAKAVRHHRAHMAEGAAGTAGAGRRYPLFHTDAAQGALYGELDVERLGVDMLTLDGGKICGPRGIGALYLKRGTPIEPIAYGGGQERGLRSGTEDLSAIMGFAEALDIAQKGRDKEAARIQGLKREFQDRLLEIRPDIKVNAPNSSHILSVSIPGIDNEFFVLQLDARGIACSTKSSCLRDEDESYVLKAIGADSKASIRLSFGRTTKKGDIKKAILAISRILC
ncbi:MAG: cysteine desulfurase [Patescibacteria group bacterium]|nr:cysteine desulfurase [Patescibacteria group bacterium]